MQTIYIMCGIPGAGKTTYARQNLSHAVYLGTDGIREELFGKELTLRGHGRVHRILHRRAREWIAAGKDVVIDCMNLSRKDRKVLLRLIPPHCRAVCVYLATPVRTAIQQNKQRKRKVPTIGILFLRLLRLQEPSSAEGFELITPAAGAGNLSTG